MLDKDSRATVARRTPWNKGKLIGAKPPLRPNQAWSIRTRLLIGSWSSSSAIWLRPHRSGQADFPHPALPEGNPRHIRACAQVRVMRGTGRRKRAVRVSNSDQPMRRLFWLRRLRQRNHVRRTSR